MTAEQIPLIPARAPRRARARRPVAEHLPVARVALLTPVPHLDRPFDYEVPAALAESAQPGVRVRVRLAGRLVDGFVLERVATSERDLQPLGSVHGPPVLTGEVAALCRAVADRYAGTLADVLRFAVPPRHARAEAGMATAPAALALAPVGGPPTSPAWDRYRGGPELLAGIGGVAPARALWVSAPGDPPGERIAELVAAVLARGRGALVVVPDAADVARVATALDGHLAGAATVTRLVADAGPESRYRAFLQVLAGASRGVVGTRAAVFAPVVDLGAIIVWDDGDDSLAEPQAPGWHAREVAALRSSASDVSLVIGGPAVSLESARMAATGWLTPVALPRPVLRAAMPRVQVSADAAHGDPVRASDRIPSVALEVLRTGVVDGPVLVGVPRTGYLPALACQACREQARCPECGAPLHADDPARRPTCSAHGPLPHWRCPICAGDRLRATVVGVRRTAEEFGRALPGVTVLTSSGDAPVRALSRPRCLVVATPGAEPDPGPDGYAALVLLDVAAALSRPGLRVAEEVLRRWLLAA
jgi:primosomal protein N' (replication factor Y)